MSNPIVFYCRCKPDGYDIIDIVRKEKRAFIGYPAWRKEDRQDHSFLSALHDISSGVPASDALSRDARENGYKSQININCNLVRDVGDGSIVLVPRPALGLVYVGLTCGFELVDNPDWKQDFLDLQKKKQSLDANLKESHVANVVQGWKVDKWRDVPFTAIPAWIRRSLFGRSTLGRIRAFSVGQRTLDPYSALTEIINQQMRVRLPETADPQEIEERLLTDIGPNTFEHLVVALLQLERPEEVWSHVGGTGDGGVDGIGTDLDGKVVGLLQCKWKYDGGELPFESDAKGNFLAQLFVATLLHSPNLKKTDGATLWNRPEIAKLMLKHAGTLPWAKSLRIAVGKSQH